MKDEAAAFGYGMIGGILLAGLVAAFVIGDAPRDSVTTLQTECVERGVAEWAYDGDGQRVFLWLAKDGEGE